MSDTQDADPRDVLNEIAERVERIESLVQDQQDFRLDISEGTRFRKAVKYLAENPGSTSGDMESVVNNATRALTTLYYAGYVDRQSSRPYEYFLSKKGRVVLDRARSSEQSTLDDGDNGNDDEDSNPWDNADVGESEYLALKLVNEYEGNPLSRDIVDDFTDEGFAAAGNSISQLSTLETKGYVERTPQPHRYWLTDDGKEILNTAEQ